MQPLLNISKKIFSTEYFIQLISAVAVFVGLIHLGVSIVSQSMTYDEYNHFSFSRVLLDTKIPPERISGHISTTPVIILNVISGDLLKDTAFVERVSHAFGVSSEWWPKKVPGLFWYSALLVGTFLLGRLLYGWYLPYLLLVSVALSPTLISHASVVTVDLAYATAVVFLTYFLCLTYQTLTLFRVLMSGFFLGLSLIIKFTGLLLIPVFVVFIAISVLKSTKINRIVPKLFLCVISLLLSSYVASLAISASYLFVEMKYWTLDYEFKSGLLNSLLKLLPTFYFPLPQSFLSGIDACFQTERGGSWNVILWDEFLTKGSVWYFPANYLYKTPFSIILLTAMGLLLSVVRGTINRSYVLLALFLTGFYYFCFIFQTQVGFRYVLFLVPLFYALSYSSFRLARPKFFLISTLIILLEGIFTFAPFIGYLLSYYNPVFVPSDKPYMYVTDSNFDWGHTGDLFWSHERLSKMLDTGTVDTEILQPGRNTFSANRLVGVLWDFPKRAWIRRNLTPFKTLAHTFFVFDVNAEQFSQYLKDERTLFEEEVAKKHCIENAVPIFDIQKKLIDSEGKQLGTEPGQYCLYTKNEQVISISAVRITKDNITSDLNHVSIGAMQMSGDVRYDEINQGQKAWFRLLPGYHVISIKRENNRENEDGQCSFVVSKN